MKEETLLPQNGFNQIKRCRHGVFLYNRHDIYVGRSLELYGEFSYGETQLFEQIVKPGGIVLDIGANIGCHSVRLAQLVGPKGMVLAFEPQHLVFQLLCANGGLNNLVNLRAYCMALGRENGSIRVPVMDPNIDNNFGGLGLGEFDFGEVVDLRPLDSFKLPRCQLMKIDVEGMEAEVIGGALETIERCKPVLYVENDRPEKSENLIRLIDSMNYDMYWHLPPLYNPKNFAENDENVFGKIVSKNMLCIHNSREQNITGLPRVEVP